MQGDDDLNKTTDTSQRLNEESRNQTNVNPQIDNNTSDEQLVTPNETQSEDNDELGSATPQEISINVPVANSPFPPLEEPKINAQEIEKEDSEKMEKLMVELQQLRQKK